MTAVCRDGAEALQQGASVLQWCGTGDLTHSFEVRHSAVC